MIWLWFVAALVVLGAELLIGTVYLLALALGLVAGGAAAWFGFGDTVAWMAVAIVTLAGCLGVRSMRRKKGEAETLQEIDVGRVVDVQIVDADGSAMVSYRGARWRARAEEGTLTVGRWTIRRVDGTELVLGQKHS